MRDYFKPGTSDKRLEKSASLPFITKKKNWLNNN